MAGAGVLALVAVGGVVVAPKLLGGGSSDPGCTAYSGSALTAYNKTIDDLNAQASQSVLSADMSAATTDLNAAISQAKSASVKSALNGLLTQLNTVKTDVKSGSVPTSTVNALNAASTAADNACPRPAYTEISVHVAARQRPTFRKHAPSFRRSPARGREIDGA